jgi:type VI secretion system protein ImpA
MVGFPEGFDLAALLAPIAAETPSGTDLREDYSPNSLYFRLRDARTEARDAERAADAPRSENDPVPVGGSSAVPLATRWRTVRELATEALTAHCKDLEIAAWLTEALLRSDGLIGLAAGFRLMAGLAENFWDDVFPRPDEEGIATRVAPITGLNGLDREGTLIQPLGKLVLFERPSDGSPFSLSQYEQSAGLLGPEQRLASLSFDVVENEARAAGGAHFAQLRGQAAEAAEAWRALGQVLHERLDADAKRAAADAERAAADAEGAGADAKRAAADALRAAADGLPTTRIRELIEHTKDAADRFATPEAEASPEDAAPAADEAGGMAVAVPGPAAGRLGSREDALRTLTQIAEFFRRTEPLSPIAYTLQEAVRRSRMTWPELLEEIVPDALSRSAILTSLGIRPPPSE